MILDPAKTKRGTYVALKIWAVGFVGFLAYLMTVFMDEYFEQQLIRIFI